MLEVTVFDEDRDRSADFLGKIAIPLLHVSKSAVEIQIYFHGKHEYLLHYLHFDHFLAITNKCFIEMCWRFSVSQPTSAGL